MEIEKQVSKNILEIDNLKKGYKQKNHIIISYINLNPFIPKAKRKILVASKLIIFNEVYQILSYIPITYLILIHRA